MEHNKYTSLIRGPLVHEKVWISFSSVHGKTMLTCSRGAKDKYSYEKLLYPGIYRNKTMADKLMNIPNDVTQNYSFC